MNREQLKNLGLTDEQIDKVMSAHGQATQKLRDANSKLSQELSDKTAGQTDKDAQIEELTKQNKALTKKAGQVDGLTQQVDELNGKLTTNKLNDAVTSQLTAAKVRNPKAAMALLPQDQLKLDDDGNVPDLSDAIKALQESDGYLFNEGTKSNYNPSEGKPDTPDPTQAMIDAFTGKTSTPPAEPDTKE